MIGLDNTEVLLFIQVFLLYYIQVMIGPYITEVLLLYQVFLLQTGNDRTLQYLGPPIVSSVPFTSYNDSTSHYRGPPIVSSVHITYR